MLTTDDFPYLPIADGNYLVHTSSERSQRKGRDNDDDYYNELSQDGEIVATYHVWHHMSIYPPQKVDAGWKKFNLMGEQIVSGRC